MESFHVFFPCPRQLHIEPLTLKCKPLCYYLFYFIFVELYSYFRQGHCLHCILVLELLLSIIIIIIISQRIQLKVS